MADCSYILLLTAFLISEATIAKLKCRLQERDELISNVAEIIEATIKLGSK